MVFDAAGLLEATKNLVLSAHRLPLGDQRVGVFCGDSDAKQYADSLAERTLRTCQILCPEAKNLENASEALDAIGNLVDRAGEALKPKVTTTSSSNVPESSMLYFKPSRDNHAPFVPLILEKPHGKQPLQSSIVEAQIRSGMRPPGRNVCQSEVADPLESHLETMGYGTASSSDDLPHPYEAEIHGDLEPGPVLDIKEPIRYGKTEDTPLVFVKTKEELAAMVAELEKFSEVAIDLEHHDTYSYQGYTCLIQLSSREKDYIVDPFGLFDALHVLNKITCNPHIVKVLHGANRDIIWLQRDFGVYVVNMFDTGCACRCLNLPGGASLRNLYASKCGFTPDKKHQTSDWRQRPLSQEMIDYARSDTHYLLYAYDLLKQDLQEEGIMKVWEMSQELTLQRYSMNAPKIDELATKIACRWGRGQLKVGNFSALESLLAWRDQESRDADISPHCCCPDHVCFVLARKLPAANEIGAAIHPLPFPPRVRLKADAVAAALRLASPAATPDPATPSSKMKTEAAPPSLPVTQISEIPPKQPRKRLLGEDFSIILGVAGAKDSPVESSLLPLFQERASPKKAVRAIFDEIASSIATIRAEEFTLTKPVRVETVPVVAEPEEPLSCLRTSNEKKVNKKRDLVIDSQRPTKKRRKGRRRQEDVLPQPVPSAPVPAPPRHTLKKPFGSKKKRH